MVDMSINNATWLGPPNTQEYIRQLEEKLARLEAAVRALGGTV